MLLDLLQNRYSVRGFTGEEVPGETIEAILEAGRLSPSGGNEQPWRFGVITDREQIRRITEIAYHQKWIESASFLIVLCTRIIGQERGGRNIQKVRFPELAREIDEMEAGLYGSLNMEEHQTKIPGTHMAMAALEHGLYSTWISYFKVNELNELLKLPENCTASEILALGYPAKSGNRTPKKSLEELVFYNEFRG